MARRFKFASSDVGSFHLSIAIGIGSSGFERISASARWISIPCGARSSLNTVPVTRTACPSRISLSVSLPIPSWTTVCKRPSRLLKITKEISPISRMLCTIPSAVTSVPTDSSLSSSSRVFTVLSFNPVTNSIIGSSSFCGVIEAFRVSKNPAPENFAFIILRDGIFLFPAVPPALHFHATHESPLSLSDHHPNDSAA